MTASRRSIWAAALVALIVLLALLALFRPSTQEAASPGILAAGTPMVRETLELVTKTGVRTVTVDIARTPEHQSKGLMFRTALPDDHGMLFPHDTPRELSMWMRNTYIPLDMVFIRADGVVHRIEARTEPLSEKVIGSRGDVLAVLELAGGAAERFGLAAGDLVRHPLFQR